MFRKSFRYKWREYRLRALRRKSEDKREKIRERQSNNEEIRNFYLSPNIIRVIAKRKKLDKRERDEVCIPNFSRET
jgi:hypothetical protein